MDINIYKAFDKSTGKAEIGVRCREWNNQKVDFDERWVKQVVVGKEKEKSDEAMLGLEQAIKTWLAQFPEAKE
jgi:hypothetical protein